MDESGVYLAFISGRRSFEGKLLVGLVDLKGTTATENLKFSQTLLCTSIVRITFLTPVDDDYNEFNFIVSPY